MPQHADTDVQIKTPAVFTPRRSRMFSHEPFIVNKQKTEQDNIAEDSRRHNVATKDMRAFPG